MFDREEFKEVMDCSDEDIDAFLWVAAGRPENNKPDSLKENDE